MGCLCHLVYERHKTNSTRDSDRHKSRLKQSPPTRKAGEGSNKLPSYGNDGCEQEGALTSMTRNIISIIDSQMNTCKDRMYQEYSRKSTDLQAEKVKPSTLEVEVVARNLRK